MTKLQFVQVIEIRDGNPYVLVTEQLAQQLRPDWRRPMPVMIQINSKPRKPWHINMIPTGKGSFYLYLHGDVRKASDTKVGDSVTVTVEFDTAYHNGPLTTPPTWFIDTLKTNTTARLNWENLPPSRQKEVVRYFTDLKTEAARERNLKKVIAVLSGDEGRFMARDWKNGK